jgi:hypothetical protein
MPDADYGYSPDQDYSAAYNALKARTSAAYAGSRGQLAQDLATRGVQTSGVSAIPEASMLASEAGAKAAGAEGLASQEGGDVARANLLAQQQAGQLNMATTLQGNQNALARRLGQNQLAGQIGAGALSAVGSLYAS